MEVLEIINLCSKLLNEQDIKSCIKYCKDNNCSVENFITILSQTLTSGEVGYVEIPSYLTEQSVKDLRIILDCINIVQTIIAVEKEPIYFEEEIEVDNNEFNIDNLSQKIIKVLRISKDYRKQYYEIINKKIKIDSGKYLIKYEYLPQDVDFISSVNNHNGNISLVKFRYGVCSQFCLIKFSFEESQMWQDKFDNSLKNAFRKVREIRMKNRRWL